MRVNAYLIENKNMNPDVCVVFVFFIFTQWDD